MMSATRESGEAEGPRRADIRAAQRLGEGASRSGRDARMVDPDAVNVARAAAFLSERFGADVAEVAHLGTGAWSKAFGFRHAADELVVRFGAQREDFDKDQRATRFDGPG